MATSSARAVRAVDEPIVIHNLLAPKYLEDVRAPLESGQLSWYYNSHLNWGDSGAPIDHFGFTHDFIHGNEIRSVFYPSVSCLVPSIVASLKLNLLRVIRIKANLTTHIDGLRPTPHIDVPAINDSPRVLACVFYPYNSTGDLHVWNRRPSKRGSAVKQASQLAEPTWTVTPRANSCVVFDGTLFHCADLPALGMPRIAVSAQIEVGPNVVS